LTIMGEKNIPLTVSKAYESTGAGSALINQTEGLGSSVFQWLSKP